MPIAQLSFYGTKFLYGKGATRKDRFRDLEKELIPACIARNAGVSAPNYQAVPSPAKSQDAMVKYMQHGEPADINKNPITQKHIEDLFTNFYCMDKIGLYHRFLDPEHVFFTDNGRIQIDAMKYTSNFHNSGGKFSYHNPNIPDYAMPSNADSYEERGLCLYLDTMEDEEEKTDFIRTYLKEKSSYNNMRAKFLIKEGFDPKSKTVKLEKAKAEIYANPSDEVINFIKQKAKINMLEREAEKLWKQGGGFSDGKLSPKKRFISVAFLLSALKKAAMLKENANFMAATSENKSEREYFKFEKECLELLQNNIYTDIQTGVDSNFYNPNFGSQGLFLGSETDRKNFNTNLNRLDMDGFSANICDNVDELMQTYKFLIEDWTPDKNTTHRKNYAQTPVSI